MRPKSLPSKDELNSVFSYNPDTGVLTTKIRLANRVPAGSVVGSINTSGYLKVSYRNSSYTVHRIIWKMLTGEEPEVVDHLNWVRSDNRLCNLRASTYSQNNFHRQRRKTYTKIKTGKLRVSLKGKDVGYFNTWEEADAAHKAAREALNSL